MLNSVISKSVSVFDGSVSVIRQTESALKVRSYKGPLRLHDVLIALWWDNNRQHDTVRVYTGSPGSRRC